MRKIKRKHMKNNNKGISLIVLIITIIVVIILAAVVILNLSNNNPVSSAKEATFKSDIRSFQEELSMYIANKTIMDYSGNREKLTMTEVPTLDKMKEYIENYTKKYAVKDNNDYICKLGIEDDELVYYPKNVTENEKKWLDELGIKPSGYTVPEANKECFIWDETHTIITGYNYDLLKAYLEGNNNILKIPSECKGIDNEAFKNCNLFETVIIGDNVEKLGTSVFSNCQNMTSVVLSNNIEELPEHTFDNCKKLINVTLPNNLTKIKYNVFYDCSSLESIKLPDKLTQIGDWCFAYCSKLKNIDLPNSVVTLGQYCFYSCTASETIQISQFVKSVGYGCFEECNSLREINVDEGNRFYASEDGVLFDKNKTCLIKFPCKNTSVNYIIPSTVQKIEGYAFREENNIESITIPNGMTTIGSYSLSGCKKVTEINITESVTTLYKTSFPQENLASINVSVNNQNYCSIDGVLFDKMVTKLMLYPRKKQEERYEIPSSVEKVGYQSFLEAKNLKEIVIPEGVKEIGWSAFEECIGLTNVTLPNSITSIGSYMFADCSNLESVKLPDNITDMSTSVFRYCYKLKYIEIPNTVTSIGEYTFNGCNSLEQIVIPASVTKIGHHAFCTGNKTLIHCIVSSKPVGWDDTWIDIGEQTVNWGYTG